MGDVVLAGHVVGNGILGEARKMAFQEKVWADVQRNSRISNCPLIGVPVGAATVKVPAPPVIAMEQDSLTSAGHV